MLYNSKARVAGTLLPIGIWVCALFLMLHCATASRQFYENGTRPTSGFDPTFQHSWEGGTAHRRLKMHWIPDLLKKSKPKPIRIKLIYTGLRRFFTPRQVQAFEQNYGPAAVAMVTKLLQVRIPMDGPLTAPDEALQECGKDIADAVNRGIRNTDILIDVKGDPGCGPDSPDGWANICHVDPETKRPVLGIVVICPKVFNHGSDYPTQLLVHELIHVMGIFFDEMFTGGWYDQDTGRPYDKVVQEVLGRPYLVTPRVTKYAREWFGCNSLPGAPLSLCRCHWDSKYIPEDWMSDGGFDSNYITPFTAYALEDTGWYVADICSCQEPSYGKKAGCSIFR